MGLREELEHRRVQPVGLVASPLAVSCAHLWPRRGRGVSFVLPLRLPCHSRGAGLVFMSDTTVKAHMEVVMANVAVIYYSATGNVHALAEAVAEGARNEGADVRLRRVTELAPASAIDANPAWRSHLEDASDIAIATLEDLRWADGMAFGSPTRFGNISSQLKQFIDTTGPIWAEGALADKAVTGFTSAINAHGGNESTLLALYNTMYHWGALIVPPGYTNPVVSDAGGNPYGTAHRSGTGAPGDAALQAARYQGARLTRFAACIRQLRGAKSSVAQEAAQ